LLLDAAGRLGHGNSTAACANRRRPPNGPQRMKGRPPWRFPARYVVTDRVVRLISRTRQGRRAQGAAARAAAGSRPGGSATARQPRSIGPCRGGHAVFLGGAVLAVSPNWIRRRTASAPAGRSGYQRRQSSMIRSSACVIWLGTWWRSDAPHSSYGGSVSAPVTPLSCRYGALRGRRTVRC
jgi:hypothetical protein